MDPQVKEQMDAQAEQIAAILASVQKTEKYMKFIFWVTVIIFVLPLMLLMFTLPTIISSYTDALSSMDGLI